MSTPEITTSPLVDGRATSRPPEEHAANLMFTVVRHSQGDFQLEGQFTNQVVLFHPEWTPDTIDLPRAAQLFTDKVNAYLEKGFHAPLDLPRTHIDKQIFDAHDGFSRKIINRQYGHPVEVDVERTATGIIDRENHYLNIHGGRPRDTKTRMRSFLCHYGLLGNTTGAPEINELYTAAGRHLVELIEKRPTYRWSRMALEVIRTHARAYPDSGEQLTMMLPKGALEDDEHSLH